MRISLLLCTAAALFAAPAKADKFWLEDPDKQTAGTPAVIEGVLLDQNDSSYHIRVVGGELILSKRRVFKVEKTDLSLDAITKAEKKERERLAKVSERRALERSAERLRRDVRVAEASLRRSKPAPAKQPTTTRATTGGFDPILGNAVGDYLSHQQLLAELELAWTLTKDRKYLKALRRMRRLH
ncbi:MAG: hypothetical protein NXI31_19820 [bacterium]|nr:hypothetical protein [bacterium]